MSNPMLNCTSVLTAVAYVSSANRRFTRDELDALLRDARTFNAQVGVTGALLYQDGSFFQYFEGPQASVEEVYSRIKKSRQHHGIIELLAMPTRQRYFSTWSMGFAEPTTSELQTIAQAEWLTQLHTASLNASPSPGLFLLLSFWQRAEAKHGGAA